MVDATLEIQLLELVLQEINSKDSIFPFLGGVGIGILFGN
jgi:hypothetical protein